MRGSAPLGSVTHARDTLPAMAHRKTVRQLLGDKGLAVFTVRPDARVLEALELMDERDVGALPVVDQGELVGLISERDYARKVILLGRGSKDTPVADIMTEAVCTVTSKQTLEDCMALMTDRRIRHLPVVENGQLAGIISMGDVVKGLLEAHRETIEELEGYITGSR